MNKESFDDRSNLFIYAVVFVYTLTPHHWRHLAATAGARYMPCLSFAVRLTAMYSSAAVACSQTTRQNAGHLPPRTHVPKTTIADICLLQC